MKFLKVFQQTSWQVLGKAISSVSSFIILGLVARNYGEQGTGIYTLALAYLAIFYWISDLGFNAIVLQRISEGAQITQWNKLLGTRLIWSLFLVVAAILLLPFLPFATPGFSKAVSFGVLAIVGVAIFTTINLIFQWKLRYDLSVIASSVGTILLSVFIAWLAFSRQPIPYLLLSHVISWSVIVFLSIFLARKFLPRALPIIDLRYSASLFKTSWAISLSLLFNLLYFRLDAFILSYFKGSFDVGIYNLSYSVFQAVLTIPIFIMNAFYPLMLETLKKDKVKFFSQVKKAFLIMLGLSILATAFIFANSPWVVKLLVGKGFMGSVMSLQILSLGFTAYFSSALLMWVMISQKMFKRLLIIYSIGLIFNFVANLILIPNYSYIASSWITGASEYFILIMQIILLSFPRRSSTLRPLASSLRSSIARPLRFEELEERESI